MEDYASFNEVDVPGFSCIGDESDYNRTHKQKASSKRREYWRAGRTTPLNYPSCCKGI